MKVMLISLPDEGQTLDYTTDTFYLTKTVRYMPLGILSVARGMSPRHEVRILDAPSHDLSINDTLAEIEAFDPDVLGISAVTRKAYAMAEILRRADVPLKVVGGPHVTHYDKETLGLGAHAVFKHDGDYNFGAWLDGDREGGIFEDHIKDIDPLPFPQRELLNVEDYTVPEEDASTTLLKKSGARLPMFSSKGCPFRCVFCDVQEKGFRYRSATRVVDEMESILSLGATAVHILDDCFNVRRDRVLQVCAEMKRRGLKFEWSTRGRAEIDGETAQALSEAGCRRLHVGVESLDPDVLRWMNKKLDVETIKTFFKYCRQFGIETLPYFIVGTPVETREYRQRLPEMVRELGVDFPYFNLLYPASHSEYYYSLLRDGTFARDYWQDFAENPKPNYELPLPRSEELQNELQETLRSYTKQFYSGVSSEDLTRLQEIEAEGL